MKNSEGPFFSALQIPFADDVFLALEGAVGPFARGAHVAVEGAVAGGPGLAAGPEGHRERFARDPLPVGALGVGGAEAQPGVFLDSLVDELRDEARQ